jgi:hypothetical protein
MAWGEVSGWAVLLAIECAELLLERSGNLGQSGNSCSGRHMILGQICASRNAPHSSRHRVGGGYLGATQALGITPFVSRDNLRASAMRGEASYGGNR